MVQWGVDLAGVFLNGQSLTISLVIYVMTESMRRFVQASWKSWRKSVVYTEYVLWASPAANGALLALLAPNFPWPAQIERVLSARIAYAVVLGLFCGIVYSRTRKLIEVANVGEKKGA